MLDFSIALAWRVHMHWTLVNILHLILVDNINMIQFVTKDEEHEGDRFH